MLQWASMGALFEKFKKWWKPLQNTKCNTDIQDVPNETIQKCLLPYLCNEDVISFGRTSKRFKACADYVLEKRPKRSKSKIISLLNLYQ